MINDDAISTVVVVVAVVVVVVLFSARQKKRSGCSKRTRSTDVCIKMQSHLHLATLLLDW